MNQPETHDNLLLEIKKLTKCYPVHRGLWKKEVGAVKAVDNVSFTVVKGETLALAGESGCGKTTTARLILRAIEPTSGTINFRTDAGMVDINQLDRKGLHQARRQMQMVFQDPYASLNPRMTVRDIIAEPLIVQGISREEIQQTVSDLLVKVGLDPRYQERYPHAFSGGQRQRIAIARALALRPSLVVADEPVSALDVSIQAQILNLLMDLQSDFNLTYLFISHDLSVVEHIADRVAIMYAGKIVELAETETVFSMPKHPYTEALLTAIPKPDPDSQWFSTIMKGEISSKQVNGCSFNPRCPYAKDICRKEEPSLEEVELDGKNRWIACHFSDSLHLKGVM
jgi:peptide/nickel transport system ATP-binding protein